MKILKHLVPIVCIGLITLMISQFLYLDIMENEEKKSWNELETTARNVSNEIETKFSDEISKLHLIKTIMENERAFSADSIAFLHFEDFLNTNTVFDRIDVLFSDNTLVSNGKELVLNEKIKFDDIRKKGEYLTERKTDFITEKPCLYYVLPVTQGEDIFAVLIGVIETEKLNDVFKPVIYNGQANICLIDSKDGNYIMDSWHKELGNAFAMPDRKRIEGYENVDLKKEIKNQSSGTIAFISETTGTNIYMYYTPVKMFDWELAIFASEETLFADMITLRNKFVLAGIVEIALLALYCSWIFYLTERLEILSYRDMLTGMYNRHKYGEMLNKLGKKDLESVGIAYIDLNGLKQINDTNSHEKGDVFIKNAAKVISEVFPKSSYRIGGDEFIVLESNTKKEKFEAKLQNLKQKAKQNNVSFSVGFSNKQKGDSLEEKLKEAERGMYTQKQEYYKNRDRRKTPNV